jgi:hypothetical protein
VPEFGNESPAARMTEDPRPDAPPAVPGAPSRGEGVNPRLPPWSRVLRNDLRSLDASLADPGIDPKRVGALGHGLGGTPALWLRALDERIAFGVAVNGLTRLGDWQASPPSSGTAASSPCSNGT